MSDSVIARLNAALNGRYAIERELGQGGMATVFLAADLKHDRKVALKVLKPELAAVLGAERFVVEIKTTAALQHPNILPLFDSGAEGGFLYYVMPFIDGETLRSKLDRETQFGVDEAVKIAVAVAEALDYAHRHGVIHRDIKPENILLHEGRPMVADFGIALALSAAAGGRMTETGLSLGTPHYMSPEQATAEKEISARSDIYSLASVLYEMLAGQPPHLGGSAQQIIMKIITESAPSVTTLRKSVPLHVAAAVATALEKLPADRFDSAKAFADALGNTNYANASGATALAGARGGGTRSFRRPFLATLAVAVPLLVLAIWGWLRPAPPSEPSRNRIVLWDTPQLASGAVGRGLAISPDGGTVVFVDSARLFVKERNQLDATALPGTTGAVGAPTFSPDGAWIAFVSTDGKVKKVSRLGGAAIPIAGSASAGIPAVAWLDEGTILYLNPAGGLNAVGQDGGTSSLVFSMRSDANSRVPRSVFGLPGVKAALFVTCAPGCSTSDLRVLDLRSDPPKVTVLSDEVLAGWSLPGGLVAFVRRDGGVFAAPFDPGTLTFTRPPTPVLDGVRGSVNTADMAVSASGTAIYVAGSGAGASARMVEPVWVTRSGAATPIDAAWTVGVPQNTSGVLGKRVALSPDGHRLALGFLREGAGSLTDIWIKQLDRAPFTLTKLTFDGDNANPVWMPDGRALVYTSGGTTRPGLLRRRRADGTGPVDTLLKLARGINDVALTGDTTQFVLRLVSPPSRDIMRWHRGDSAATPLIASPLFSEISPALSPDGRWLAFASDESGRYEVYVSPYPDASAGRWQVSQAGGVSPIWSHSGRELFYQNGAGALVSAAVMPGPTFALGAHTVLFDASRFAGTVGALYYDVAPDDKRFVLLRLPVSSGLQGADRLVQITNWGAEVQAKLKGKAP